MSNMNWFQRFRLPSNVYYTHEKTDEIYLVATPEEFRSWMPHYDIFTMSCLQHVTWIFPSWHRSSFSLPFKDEKELTEKGFVRTVI